MNESESKRPTDDTSMNPREIEVSVKRIENDLYFSSDSVMIRLGRIEEKLEKVATREDFGCLNMDMEGLKSELIAHSNLLFRWTIGLFVSGVGVILAVLKLT